MSKTYKYPFLATGSQERKPEDEKNHTQEAKGRPSFSGGENHEANPRAPFRNNFRFWRTEKKDSNFATPSLRPSSQKGAPRTDRDSAIASLPKRINPSVAEENIEESFCKPKTHFKTRYRTDPNAWRIGTMRHYESVPSIPNMVGGQVSPSASVSSVATDVTDTMNQGDTGPPNETGVAKGVDRLGRFFRRPSSAKETREKNNHQRSTKTRPAFRNCFFNLFSFKKSSNEVISTNNETLGNIKEEIVQENKENTAQEPSSNEREGRIPSSIRELRHATTNELPKISHKRAASVGNASLDQNGCKCSDKREISCCSKCVESGEFSVNSLAPSIENPFKREAAYTVSNSDGKNEVDMTFEQKEKEDMKCAGCDTDNPIEILPELEYKLLPSTSSEEIQQISRKSFDASSTNSEEFNIKKESILDSKSVESKQTYETKSLQKALPCPESNASPSNTKPYKPRKAEMLSEREYENLTEKRADKNPQVIAEAVEIPPVFMCELHVDREMLPDLRESESESKNSEFIFPATSCYKISQPSNFTEAPTATSIETFTHMHGRNVSNCMREMDFEKRVLLHQMEVDNNSNNFYQNCHKNAIAKEKLEVISEEDADDCPSLQDTSKPGSSSNYHLPNLNQEQAPIPLGWPNSTFVGLTNPEVITESDRLSIVPFDRYSEVQGFVDLSQNGKYEVGREETEQILLYELYKRSVTNAAITGYLLTRFHR